MCQASAALELRQRIERVHGLERRRLRRLVTDSHDQRRGEQAADERETQIAPLHPVVGQTFSKHEFHHQQREDAQQNRATDEVHHRCENLASDMLRPKAEASGHVPCGQANGAGEQHNGRAKIRPAEHIADKLGCGAIHRKKQKAD